MTANDTQPAPETFEEWWERNMDKLLPKEGEPPQHGWVAEQTWDAAYSAGRRSMAKDVADRLDKIAENTRESAKDKRLRGNEPKQVAEIAEIWQEQANKVRALAEKR